MPKIFGVCDHQGAASAFSGRGNFFGFLIAEDGEVLGTHISSSEGFLASDLGMFEPRPKSRQESFELHYPDGFQTEYVSLARRETHAGLQAAIALNKADPVSASGS